MSKWVSVSPRVRVSVFGVYLLEPQVVGTYLKSSSQEGVLMLQSEKLSQNNIIIETALCACCVRDLFACISTCMGVCVCAPDHPSVCLCVIPREITLIASMKEA